MSLSPLDEFHKEQAELFSSYLSSIKSIESRMKQAIGDANKRQSELDELIESNRISASHLSRQREEEALKITELNGMKRELDEKIKQYDYDSKQLADRNKKLDDKHRLQAEKHIQLTQWEDRLKKIEQELEIEQRRNKYFEHKLNLVANDAKIKAELERIEGGK